MKVNVNNLRKKTAICLNTVIRKLNNNIDNSGTINIEADEIKEQIDSLSSLVMGLCCVYIPDNDDFKDISEEVNIEEFNPSMDETEY
jgi:hypothetical protein